MLSLSLILCQVKATQISRYSMPYPKVTVLVDTSRDRPRGLGDTTLWTTYTLSQTDPYTCLGGSWIQPNTGLGMRKNLFFGNFTFDGTWRTGNPFYAAAYL